MGEQQKPDFSGWATKNDLMCSDGRTIKAGAFAHMDKIKVPLVWMHQHNDPENVLGHAVLENRAFGVYTHGYFNETPRGQHMKEAVKHGDITSLSIYANNLSERRSAKGKEVFHGDIKEVSLVVAGANPGAFIENINLVHGDQFETLEEEAIIYTGLTLEHGADTDTPDEPQTPEVEPVVEPVVIDTPDKENADMAEIDKNQVDEIIAHASATDTKADEDKTLQEIFDGFSDVEKEVFYYVLEQLVPDTDGAEVKHSMALDEEAKSAILAHFDNKFESIKEGITDMTRNLFEQNGSTSAAVDGGRKTLSHGLLETIMKDAKSSTLKEAFLAHADGTEYGIEDIDFLFPDAKTLSNSPELLSRRTEWVAKVLGGTKHSPFSRIKSIVADITADEARAKGYVKGNLKKEEIIKLLKRVTTPTTVYKKQKLDRDDIIDITDLDVVAWLKAEMRLMLDEEIARAILVGDGREPDDEDKIDEDHLRPIAFDVDMYSEKVNIATGATQAQIEDAIIRSRSKYKGTGTPTMFTTDEVLTNLFLQRDGDGRRIYKTVEEVAASLRVSEIVVVEVMEDTPEILAIIVNLADYTIGADRGGAISMFDDFDIDYNQYKYLIETRISGALTKPKSAVVVRQAPGNVVTPTQPQYNSTTRVITIPADTGVIYSIDGVDKTAGALPAITETTEVEARPAAGYSFPHNTDADWVFVY